ncbi:hypothetical protein ACIRF8_23535 [Streptomyces sp. NPDC102406]
MSEHGGAADYTPQVRGPESAEDSEVAAHEREFTEPVVQAFPDERGERA